MHDPCDRLSALLLNLQQDNIAIAIESDLADFLPMTRLLALMPQATAGTGPVNCIPGLRSQPQRFTVHPRDHQGPPGFLVLSNGRNQPLSSQLTSSSHSLPAIDSILQSYLHPCALHTKLGLVHGMIAKMKYAGCQNGVSMADLDSIDQVLQISDAAGGDDRDANGIRYRRGEFQVEPSRVPSRSMLVSMISPHRTGPCAAPIRQRRYRQVYGHRG